MRGLVYLQQNVMEGLKKTRLLWSKRTGLLASGSRRTDRSSGTDETLSEWQIGNDWLNRVLRASWVIIHMFRLAG